MGLKINWKKSIIIFRILKKKDIILGLRNKIGKRNEVIERLVKSAKCNPLSWYEKIKTEFHNKKLRLVIVRNCKGEKILLSKKRDKWSRAHS